MTDPIHSPLARGPGEAWSHTYCGLPWASSLRINWASKRITCVACREARLAAIARARERAA